MWYCQRGRDTVVWGAGWVSPYLEVLLCKAARRTPDSPVKRQLLGNEVQLLNDISRLLNLDQEEEEQG